MLKKGPERMDDYEKQFRSNIPVTRISGSNRFTIPGLGEVRVSGSGSLSPEMINVSGSAHLPGGFKVGTLRSSGSTTIDGDIQAQSITTSGSTSIGGTVQAVSQRSSGSFTADGDALGETMRFSGSAKIGGTLNLEDSLHANGSISIRGDAHAGNLVEFEGVFNIGGRLTTKTLKAWLSRDRSYVEDGIKAEVVDIRKDEPRNLGSRLERLFNRWEEGDLRTTDIEGAESVYLENVTCDNVTGGRVTIDEGCRIRGSVTYMESIEVHPDARLENPPQQAQPEG